MQEHNPISRHVLNLGAGVQSTTLYLMYLRGEIQPAIECAIFADTPPSRAPAKPRVGDYALM